MKFETGLMIFLSAFMVSIGIFSILYGLVDSTFYCLESKKIICASKGLFLFNMVGGLALGIGVVAWEHKE